MVVNDCFPNVDKLIGQYGGSIEHGWLLWEALPGLLLSAEFHAIWIDSKGNRREVTPSDLRHERIAFLPDPARTYEGRQVNNVQMSLKDNPLIDKLIAWEDSKFALMNDGDLADYHGAVELPGEFMHQGMTLMFTIFDRYYSPGRKS
jgi:hypothetical protein